MNLDSIIREVQAKLGVTADGKAGPKTWTAIRARVVTSSETISPDVVMPSPAADAKADARSETNIATLHPRVQPYARALVHAAKAQDIIIKVTSGTRTYAEQDALFAKGGVTNARGGQSNHNFGIAFDVTVFDDDNKTPIWDGPQYAAVASLGRNLGLECGADWKSFKDDPHYQLRPYWAKGWPESRMLAELRDRAAVGRDAFA